ncbi:hypothetical protein FA95DRAFT_916012 [Auriscalpium vulgare]|uniref:Uncharacterized protein n=1 Tax=Auriscalpium vulgare TaxID=40419 RepID=A0ACB8R7K6_9AGAM|nr:hypothetical protein FA95DRAFT_916012 [Auriscalpium vulgare]
MYTARWSKPLNVGPPVRFGGLPCAERPPELEHLVELVVRTQGINDWARSRRWRWGRRRSHIQLSVCHGRDVAEQAAERRRSHSFRRPCAERRPELEHLADGTQGIIDRTRSRRWRWGRRRSRIQLSRLRCGGASHSSSALPFVLAASSVTRPDHLAELVVGKQDKSGCG